MVPAQTSLRLLVLALGLGIAQISPSPVVAQSQTSQVLPASLSADRIVYTSGYRTLRATGNVVITYRQMILEADELLYDERNDRITATGPLRLRQGENITILADYAELSTDMQSGVLKSARMVLNKQLQISAVEISRSGGRYSQLYKAVASSCTVSEANPTPLWQMRAKRIIHDQEKKRLFFENAQLRIGKVPVAYIPRLRVPGPSVKRASGFLVPALGQSTAYGSSVTAPYFLTFGEYADLKLTPTLYSSGTTTLQFDHRRRFHNGKLNITGAYTRDTVAAQANRGYLFATGDLTFANGLRASMDLQFVSDINYFLNHGLSEKERLESFVRLDKTTSKSFFATGIKGFRTLRTAVSSDTIPYLVNEAAYSRRYAPEGLGGLLQFNIETTGLSRRSTTDIIGRDLRRISSSLNWRRDWVMSGGLVLATIADVRGDIYYVDQDSTYPTPVYRMRPATALELRWPLARSTAGATEVIEPKVQLVWSPNSTTAVPNDDSLLVDFETSNLFSLNRFAGVDQQEAGLRANIGFTYSRRSATGVNIDATLGRVVRAQNLGQFTAASGLSGSMSSYVGSIDLRLPSKLRLVERAVFDGAFAVTKNETSLIYKAKKFDVSSSYLWLTAGAAANLVDRSEWSVNTGINLGRNWRTETTWRYDLVTSAASDAGVALTYRNECIKLDLTLSRSFVSSSNISASTDLGLQVTLEGFGSRANSDAYHRKCSDI